MPGTIKDIARAAGVSVSTVSRILNGKSSQNRRLITLVKEKAREMNYQVNTAAAGLRTNRTRLIGIVMPEINNDFFSEILSGVEEVVESEGYNLLICQSHESSAKELKLIASLNACNVEGILIASSIESYFSDELENEFQIMGRKVVYFDRVPNTIQRPFITGDDFGGLHQVTEHLLQQGKSRFFYVGFHQALANNTERLRGVTEALQAQGLALLDTFYDPSPSDLLLAIQRERADALICYNDHIAAQMLSYLKQGGIHVPDQIAVTGFDNRSLCELVSPTLTSVDHSTRALGKGAAEMLFHWIQHEEKSTNIVLPAKLVVRESSINNKNEHGTIN